uniref:Uncharacterized protein n=1 Tax=Timema shepardi TaxID=629360 RepID=A0A7R9FV33_TIMSH|nr:unnamed protein product [Timema shepardi]
MEGQDVCTRKAKPAKPLAITSIFNTLFPLDEVDAKRIIVGSESPTFHGGQTTFSVPKVTLEDGATSPGHHELPNEISAPYEVPQFPIEQIEKKLAIQRHISSRCGYSGPISYDDDDDDDDDDYVVLVEVLNIT